MRLAVPAVSTTSAVVALMASGLVMLTVSVVLTPVSLTEAAEPVNCTVVVVQALGT